MKSQPTRLQKFLAEGTELSRRAAEAAIARGEVSVNGKVIKEMGVKVTPGRDRVHFKGKPVYVHNEKAYIALYKKFRTIVSKKDPEGRPTIWDFLPVWMKERLNSAGRLDYDSEGLIILTNDGNFLNRLIHPSHDVPKKYQVKVKGRLDKAQVDRLEKGVALADGVTREAKVKVIREEAANTWIEITVREGKYRLIRRMISGVGSDVLKLKRVSIGNIKLGMLTPGRFRELTPQEVRSI